VEIISTEANGVHLCAEPTPDELAQLIAKADPATPLGAYLERHFARFGDFGGLPPAHPNRTFSGELVLDVGGVTVRLIEVGPAHTTGDLIVHLPEEGVVCAGDVVFSGDHPVHWAGPIEQVHRATQRVLQCDPRVIVPGHGPLMTPAGVREYADYLLELRESIHTAHRAGRTLTELSAELIAGDPRPQWGLTERLAILAATEYRALNGDPAPPNLVALVDFAAAFAADVATDVSTVSTPVANDVCPDVAAAATGLVAGHHGPLPAEPSPTEPSAAEPSTAAAPPTPTAPRVRRSRRVASVASAALLTSKATAARVARAAKGAKVPKAAPAAAPRPTSSAEAAAPDSTPTPTAAPEAPDAAERPPATAPDRSLSELCGLSELSGLSEVSALAELSELSDVSELSGVSDLAVCWPESRHQP